MFCLLRPTSLQLTMIETFGTHATPPVGEDAPAPDVSKVCAASA